MSRKNSQSRLQERRKSALVRRQAELAGWKTKLHASPEDEAIMAKIAIAEKDIANTQAKVGHY